VEHTASQKWEVGHHSVGEGQQCTSFLRIDQLVRNKWPVTYRLDLWHASSSWRDLGQTRWSKLNGRNLRSHGRKPFQRGRCDLEWGLSRFVAVFKPEADVLGLRRRRRPVDDVTLDDVTSVRSFPVCRGHDESVPATWYYGQRHRQHFGLRQR